MARVWHPRVASTPRTSALAFYFELVSKHSLRIVVLWLFLSYVHFGQRMRTLQYGTWKGECEARALGRAAFGRRGDRTARVRSV